MKKAKDNIIKRVYLTKSGLERLFVRTDIAMGQLLSTEPSSRWDADYWNPKFEDSLPRGIFKEGTSTSRKSKGSKTATMKMSILFAEKIALVKVIKKDKIDLKKLDYKVFLASIKKPKVKALNINDWLKPELDLVLENWKQWESSD